MDAGSCSTRKAGAARLGTFVVVLVAAIGLNQGRAVALCADKIITGAEQCDDGGVCIGGPLAGSECSSEAQCLSGGACFGGLDDLHACESDGDCRDGVCRRCRPVGGDGCAANCTFETSVGFDLVDTVLKDWIEVEFGTSGAIIFSPILTVPLSLSAGSMEVTAGRTIDGVTPVVVRANGIDLPAIPVSTIACACLRLPAQFTCGGTLTDLDGTISPNCTPGFIDRATCPAARPCAPLHGDGNAGSGLIECGVSPIDVHLDHDCNANYREEPFDPSVRTTRSTELGDSTKGNGLLALSAALGTTVGECIGTKQDTGADGRFCTDDDPITSRGVPAASRFTTGSADGTILNPADFIDVLGPFVAEGRAFTCGPDGSLDLSHGIISSAFSACDQPTVSDIVTPISLAFEVAPALPEALSMPCSGDCDRRGAVTVDELVKLVSVALGTTTLGACPVGDADGDTSITVDEVTAAVDRALHGCPADLHEDACGNHRVDDDEQCDDGGTCIGGPLAGVACGSEPECGSGGACFGGLDDLRACEDDNDCRGGTCRRCRPMGGDGCAANCTAETEIPIDLVPGIYDAQNRNHELEVRHGSSGVGLFSSFFYAPAGIGGRLTLIAGGSSGGVTPVVFKAGGLAVDPFDFTLACDCLRLPEAWTCGGTAYELDGTPSLDCTADFNGVNTCPPGKPCTPLHGAGNGGSGFISCGGAGVDIGVAQACNEQGPGPAVVTIQSAQAARVGVGQALITLSPAIARTNVGCRSTSTAHGLDGEFCTDDDPASARGTPSALSFGNGTATGVIVEGFRGGPFGVEGAPFQCGPEGSIDIRRGGIATAWTTCDQPSHGDHIVSPAALFFESARIIPARAASRAGDCCQCHEPIACHAPTAGSCGDCGTLNGAACDSESGNCRLNTPTPSNTPTATPIITQTRTKTNTRPPTPAGTPHTVTVAIGEAVFGDTGSTAIVAVSLRDRGVVDVENRIVFNNRIIAPTDNDCQINPAIGRFPNGPEPAPNCDDAPGIGPCKSLSTTLQTCASIPLPPGCPPGAGSETSVLTQAVVGNDIDSAAAEIPVGVLYTCEFRLVNPGGLPTVLANRNMFAVDFGGRLLPTIGVDGIARLGP